MDDIVDEINENIIEELQKKVGWYEKKYGPYIEERSIHNWRNLFRKPNIYEIVIFIMLVLSLFMYWAYTFDQKGAFQNGYNTCLYNLTGIVFQPSGFSNTDWNTDWNSNFIENFSLSNVTIYKNFSIPFFSTYPLLKDVQGGNNMYLINGSAEK